MTKYGSKKHRQIEGLLFWISGIRNLFVFLEPTIPISVWGSKEPFPGSREIASEIADRSHLCRVRLKASFRKEIKSAAETGVSISAMMWIAKYFASECEFWLMKNVEGWNKMKQENRARMRGDTVLPITTAQSP